MFLLQLAERKQTLIFHGAGGFTRQHQLVYAHPDSRCKAVRTRRRRTEGDKDLSAHQHTHGVNLCEVTAGDERRRKKKKKKKKKLLCHTWPQRLKESSRSEEIDVSLALCFILQPADLKVKTPDSQRRK